MSFFSLVPFARYTLLILDLTLPGATGFEILAHLRRQDVRVPVLILSARNDTRDKVHALALGARAMPRGCWGCHISACIS